jgi:hypothetical protein
MSQLTRHSYSCPVRPPTDRVSSQWSWVAILFVWQMLTCEEQMARASSAGKGWLMGMGSARAPGGRRSEQEIILEEADSDGEVTPEALDRALELLVRWALKHGQKG